MVLQGRRSVAEILFPLRRVLGAVMFQCPPPGSEQENPSGDPQCAAVTTKDPLCTQETLGHRGHFVPRGRWHVWRHYCLSKKGGRYCRGG